VVVKGNLVFLGMMLFILGGCQSEKDRKIEALQTELASVRSAIDGCENAMTELRTREGDASLSEWDIAAAGNVDKVSPEQEWEIRKSLGAEMGLAPSEVNGWKEIYKSRAEAARSKKASESEAIERARRSLDAFCKDDSKNRARGFQLETQIQSLGGIA
jgi:hypothetical protein